MKGFVVTLDSVVAVSFLCFAILIIASQTYQPRAPGGIYLKQLTMDTLTVLDKTGRLRDAIGGNSSAVQEVLEATPRLACIDIAIFNATGEPIAYAAKSGCNETSGLDMQVTVQPVLYGGTGYIARSESWFRKEPG